MEGNKYGKYRDMGDKGKSPSHLHISFPTKKLPSISSMAFIYFFFPPEMHGLKDCILPLLNMAPLSGSPSVKRSTKENGIGQKKKMGENFKG